MFISLRRTLQLRSSSLANMMSALNVALNFKD